MTLSRLWLAALGVTLVLAACSQEPTATPEPTPTPVPASDQRVVYVSDDEGVYTIKTDGTGRERIVGTSIGGGVLAAPLLQESVAYSWPTWSPVGDRLVVSRSPGPISRSVAGLELITPPSSRETGLHVTNRGLVDRVADGAFHYSVWSPDGEHLALIAPAATGDSLELTEPSFDGGAPDVIARGAPIYVQWSPDSSTLAVHHRQRLILRDDRGGLHDLRTPSFSYRVPAFSADSRTLAYVADVRGDQPQFTVRDVDSEDEKHLWPINTDAVFAWSPVDPLSIAMTVRSSFFGFDYDGLAVFNSETARQRSLYKGQVFAFWWSPDGTKIAIATGGERFFQWKVIDVATAEVTDLSEFRPAPDFVTYIQFFDQFAASHEVWSSDSSQLVFSGDIAGDGARLSDQAWIVDVSGERDPVALDFASEAYFVPQGAD